MTPSPDPTGAAQAPMPPLKIGGPAGPPPGGGFLAALVSGIGPIQQDVAAIRQACQRIVQSGIGGPNVMQMCAQIIALSQQIIGTVAQTSMLGMGGPGGGPGGGGQIPAPGTQGQQQDMSGGATNDNQ